MNPGMNETSIDLIEVLFRWLHIAAVIVAIGGAFFTAAILRPAAGRTLAADADVQLRNAVMTRWRRVVHICIGLILISGLAGAYYVMRRGPLPAAYLPLLAVKVLVSLGVFFLASALVGRSAAFAGLRQRAGRWLALLIALAALIVLLAGLLRSLH